MEVSVDIIHDGNLTYVHDTLVPWSCMTCLRPPILKILVRMDYNLFLNYAQYGSIGVDQRKWVLVHNDRVYVGIEISRLAPGVIRRAGC